MGRTVPHVHLADHAVEKPQQVDRVLGIGKKLADAGDDGVGDT